MVFFLSPTSPTSPARMFAGPAGGWTTADGKRPERDGCSLRGVDRLDLSGWKIWTVLCGYRLVVVVLVGWRGITGVPDGVLLIMVAR